MSVDDQAIKSLSFLSVIQGRERLAHSGYGREISAPMPSDPVSEPSPQPPPSSALEQARRFDAFVKRYRRPLLQYFRRRGADAADAEDLTQTVFLRLLNKLQHDGDSLSDAYVFTAASSVLVDHHRRRAANFSGAAVELDPDLASGDPTAYQILEDRQTLGVMLSTLSKMTPKRRRAFMLHRFDALNYAAIAQRMGISASSVEKYVMAALAELRDSTDRKRRD
jgi:RNA polymerase sigma-70 factor (ECF subfamily)